MEIPAQYVDQIQTIHFNKGIPISWLAAVCEMTGWDPDFFEKNYDRVPNSVRRFGIAGVWASAPEITFPSDQVHNCPYWNTVPAGWVPAVYWAGNQLWQGTLCYCPPCPQHAQNLTSVEDNLNLAADILLNCGEWVERICGEYNELIFLRWIWGCSYVPEFNYDLGKCIIPPGLPDMFKREVDDILVAQKIYAEQYGEPPLVPDVYLLTVTSQNVMGATFRLDNTDYATPASIDVPAGEYTLTAVDTLVGEYEFKGWWIQGELHEMASVAISVYSPMSIVMGYALSGEPPTPPPSGMGMGLGLLLAGVAVTGGGVLLYKQEMERRKRGGR